MAAKKLMTCGGVSGREHYRIYCDADDTGGLCPVCSAMDFAECRESQRNDAQVSQGDSETALSDSVDDRDSLRKSLAIVRERLTSAENDRDALRRVLDTMASDADSLRKRNSDTQSTLYDIGQERNVLLKRCLAAETAPYSRNTAEDLGSYGVFDGGVLPSFTGTLYDCNLVAKGAEYGAEAPICGADVRVLAI